MATYNFTVRATDNLGAYADQNFSLTVNNTNIERWVIVGSTGLAHSSDGVNWTVETGQSGGKVAFGNGKWVVYGGPGGALGMNIRTSTDAFNWTTVASGIPSTYTSPATVTCINNGAQTIAVNSVVNLNTINSLKYQNGLWTAVCNTSTLTVSGGGNSFILEYTSPDLVTWTLKSVSAVNSGGNNNSPASIYDHYTDSNGLTVINYFIPGAAYLASRQPNAAVFTNYISGISNQTAGSIAYVNGLYCVSVGTLGVVWTSIDGIGWTSRTVGTGMANMGFAYANGRLLTHTVPSSSNNPTAYYSLNGGRTWVSGGNTSVANAQSGYVNFPSASQNCAYYGGRFIMLKGSSDAIYATSTDSGTTFGFEVSTIGSQIGIAAAIGVRV